MKVKAFAVSVQYGQGYHYFVRYDLNSLPEAVEFAVGTLKRLIAFNNRRRKKAKPVVHVWELKNSRAAETPLSV